MATPSSKNQQLPAPRVAFDLKGSSDCLPYQCKKCMLNFSKARDLAAHVRCHIKADALVREARSRKLVAGKHVLTSSKAIASLPLEDGVEGKEVIVISSKDGDGDDDDEDARSEDSVTSALRSGPSDMEL